MTPKPVAPRVAVKPGDTVHLAEADYKYGRGGITLRITRIGSNISQWYDGTWVWLEGIPVRWDDTDGDPRSLLARVSALRSKT
jgi:hypothetical protein